MKKIMFVLCLLILTASTASAGIFSSSIGKALAYTAGRVVVNKAISSTPPAENINIDKELSKVMEAVNKLCPMKIDEITTLKNVTTGPGRQITYNYILIDFDSKDLKSLGVQAQKFAQQLQAENIKTKACTNKMIKRLLDLGLNMIHVYNTSDGAKVFQVHVTQNDCH